MDTILVVDDNKNIRRFCESELKDAGYNVVLSADGQEALRVFPEFPIDLVVLDVRMPRLNGLETIARMQAVKPEVPIVFFTAYHKDCKRDYRGATAAAWVEKKEDLSELKSTIASVLDRRNRNRAPLATDPGHAV
jgi:two-component system OmpR family response regulator